MGTAATPLEPGSYFELRYSATEKDRCELWLHTPSQPDEPRLLAEYLSGDDGIPDTDQVEIFRWVAGSMAAFHRKELRDMTL